MPCIINGEIKDTKINVPYFLISFLAIEWERNMVGVLDFELFLFVIKTLVGEWLFVLMIFNIELC
jgi:hypothetical protein